MEEHQKFEYRRVRHPNRGIFLGVVLIMLGIIFVLQQVAGMSFDNWWALFILVPAFSSFAAAMRLYQTHNRVNNAVVSALFSGLIVLTVALLFLFNLDWGIYWPLFILLPGLSMLVNGLLRPSSPSGRIANGLLKPWLVWIGGGAFLLSAGFLLKNLGIFDPAAVHYRWWAACILLVSLGGVITALRLFGKEGKKWPAVGSLMAALVVAAPGVVALFGLDWNLITPISIICVGLVLLISFFFNR